VPPVKALPLTIASKGSLIASYAAVAVDEKSMRYEGGSVIMADRNLLKRLRNYKVVPDNEPTLDQEVSLTERRRRFALSRPVSNKSTAEKFKSARNKLKGVYLWSKLRHEIQLYGTSSNLFDQQDSYKSNLKLIMMKKNREKKTPNATVWPCWLMGPDNRFKQVWSFVVILLLLYTFILTPYLIAFEDVVIGSSWFIVDVFVDSCFFIDILVTLNSAYINRDGEYVTSRKQIFVKYLKGMLVIDFISVFPFYVINSGTSTRSNVFIRFLRMARLTRIVRASKIINIMKHFTNSPTMESFVNFLKTYSGVTRLITAVLVVLLVTHFTACMWYYSARLDDFSPDTWIVRFNLQDKDKSRLYTTALYWALTTLTTVGYGEIFAYTIGEKVICMLWMMFGVGFYSFTVGTLSSVLSSMDSKSSMINTKLSLVGLFSKDTQLPDDLVKRVNKFVKSQFENLTLDDKQRQGLLMQLPKSLRYEIAMSMYGQAATKVDFFNGQEVAFIANIVPLLQHTLIPDNEFIYYRGDYPEEVYFLVSGRVNYVYSQHNTIFKTIVTGSYFGETELLDKVPREFSAVTKGNSEFLIMNKVLFESVMREYPKVAETFNLVADARRKRNLAAQHELVELLEQVDRRQPSQLILHTVSHDTDRRSKSVGNRTTVKKSAQYMPDVTMEALAKELGELKGLAVSIKEVN
jgi:CRP-like cAMP-binding protein